MGRSHTMKYKNKQLVFWETDKAYLITMIDNEGKVITKYLYDDQTEYGSWAKSTAFFISDDELVIKGTGKGFSFYRFGKVNLSEFF